MSSKKRTHPTLFRKKQALQYAARGWHVLPLYTISNGRCTCANGDTCAHPGKHPRTPSGFKDATADRQQIKNWNWSGANIGIATGKTSGIFVIDIDGEVGKASFEALQAEHGKLPKTVTVKTGRGRHYYFHCDDAGVRSSIGKLAKNIDIRGDGGYVVGAGSVHESGFTYSFVQGRGPDEVEVARAPKWLLDRVTAKARHGDSKARHGDSNDHPEIPHIPPEKLDRAKLYANAALCREMDRLGKAPQHQRNDTLNVAAFKLGQFLPYGILDAQMVSADLVKVAREIGLDDNEILPTITSGLKAGARSPRRLPFVKSSVATAKPTDKTKAAVTEELSSLGETDTDNGQRFAGRFGNTVINTPGQGWLVYDGKRWRRDELMKVKELAKKTARLISSEARFLKKDDKRTTRRKFATQSLSTGALDRMLESAKSLLAVEDSRLDADIWLLNVDNGTVDLRTGRRERHDPRDLLTKMAPVRADRKAKCPLFKKFLRRIADNDTETQTYIQQCVGYSLTGDMSAQAFFFVYGRSGNNGKSTLVNLVRDMLGDYGLHTPTETFLTKQYDNNIPADLARLAGARMVTAIEANANRQFDEAENQGRDRRRADYRSLYATKFHSIYTRVQALDRCQ